MLTFRGAPSGKGLEAWRGNFFLKVGLVRIRALVSKKYPSGKEGARARGPPDLGPGPKSEPMGPKIGPWAQNLGPGPKIWAPGPKIWALGPLQRHLPLPALIYQTFDKSGQVEVDAFGGGPGPKFWALGPKFWAQGPNFEPRAQFLGPWAQIWAQAPNLGGPGPGPLLFR